MKKFWMIAALGYIGVAVFLAMVFWPSDLDRVRSAQDKRDFTKALKLLKPLADKGDAEALFLLGGMHELGNGLNASDLEAGKWYQAAGKLGHGKAQFSLGRLYSGTGRLEADIPKAVKWYTLAVASGEPEALEALKELASQGHGQASLNLGNIFSSGIGVPKTDDRAAEWYSRAASLGATTGLDKLKGLAENGSAHAGFLLAQMFDKGAGGNASKAESLAWYAKAASLNHRQAQFVLGSRYLNGDGVNNKNHKLAAAWLEKAAGQGHAQAQYLLGLLYEAGRGVPENHDEAVKWFLKAENNDEARAASKLIYYAGKGFTRAQFRLGEMYYVGRNVPEDNSEAAKWYKMAGDKGHVQAQFNLGYLYVHGQGVSVDEDEALRWFEKAMVGGNIQASKKIRDHAAAGNPEAQYLLGMYFAAGRTIPEKKIKKITDLIGIITTFVKKTVARAKILIRGETPAAVIWLEKAAKQDHVKAQYELGLIYASGNGVPENPDEALIWLKKAAAQGHRQAAARLKEM